MKFPLVSTNLERPNNLLAQSNYLPLSSTSLRLALSTLAGADGKLSAEDFSSTHLNNVSSSPSPGGPDFEPALDFLKNLYRDVATIPGGGIDRIATVEEVMKVINPVLAFVLSSGGNREIINGLREKIIQDPNWQPNFQPGVPLPSGLPPSGL